ncbi:hypothetical protein [Bombiscardovia coagulans]|uniref:CobQ/CobB/MinD/ParA nucleotide binding domain-containing protein n=1 Tax=Bombiscardovia coagulans TaxID=686666 RepID=A0A261ESN4_9BIFI|nr:hypothetical protein [Bombiscardovia coagulans]OZG49858.1 hypothetical protein BOCO_0375 [Bombiscardovia coagulans]
MTNAPVTFVTGGSGGLGKSSAARALAQALGLSGCRTVLVDGNPGQQSQRAFLQIDRGIGLERAELLGLSHALLMPRQTGTAFAFLPGPVQAQADTITDLYGSALVALRQSCDSIIVDADRIDRTMWQDTSQFAGGVIRPFIEHGAARILFRIGQTGSQLDDGLDALHEINKPEQILAVSPVSTHLKARKNKEWRQLLQGLAQWGGTDEWTEQSARMIDQRQPGWKHGNEPPWLQHAAIWAGAKPDSFSTQRRNHWPWTRQ